jgi:poly-gamma-glutamate synthase PgsB/CapB
MSLFLLFVPLVAWLVLERLVHERRLRRIPIRIHVNGTRGKTSVTLMIAGAFRRAGIRTLAKTTGGRPCLVLPDGTEEVIRRRSPANVLEQMAVVRRAAALGAEALVVECMALDPALQKVTERRMIQATIGVVTNVRPDHFEVMGPSLEDVARALTGTVPKGGALVLGHARFLALFTDAAVARGTRVVIAGGAAGSEPNGSSSSSFGDNIAIARAVCREAGMDERHVDRFLEEDAGRWGAKEAATLRRGGRTLHLVDAFGANDVESTRLVLDRVLEARDLPRPLVALYNNRADRPLRMKSFAEALRGGQGYDRVAVTGEGSFLAWSRFRKTVPSDRLIRLPGRTTDAVLDRLVERVAEREFTIVGIGNEQGLGKSLVQAFQAAGA